MLQEHPLHLRKVFFYQILLGVFLAGGILYFKEDLLSFISGFVLGQAYAGFTLWLIVQLFKNTNKVIFFGAFTMKWGALALILYILLKHLEAVSFIVGLSGFLSFWFFLALEFRRKEPSSKNKI